MRNILSLRHFLLLFLSVTLISCAGDDDGDDANGGRTTDPIIGSWRTVEDGDIGDLTFTSDGNYNGSWTYPDYPEDNETFMGTWSNNGTVFSSTTQIYTFTSEEGSDTMNATFSEDFNSVTFDDDDTWIRQ